MAKRFIGIDIDSRFVRVAIAAGEKGKTTLESADKKPYGDEDEMLAAIRELVGQEAGYGDRLAAALPAMDGFVRWLTFPFADSKKIESAIPFELSSQLPIAAEDCVTDFRKPISGDNGQTKVAAAAIPQEVVQRFLDPLDHAGIPLNILDMAPFAFVRGLGAHQKSAIIVCLTKQERTVALLADGHITEYRILPGGEGLEEDELCRLISREATIAQNTAGFADLPIYLMGSEATPSLVAALGKIQKKVEVPAFSISGKTVQAEFLPAVTLALRAAISEKEKEFNFRRGQFALKSEWAALKKGLTVAAAILALCAMALGGSAYLNYSHKADRAETLKRQMVDIYKETFPGARTIVDVPLQMKSKLNEIKKKGRFVEGGQRSPLGVIQEISRRIPEELSVDVGDLSYTPESVRLEGHTVSFDAINRIAKSLEQSPLFSSAKIADAKMSLDGSRVDFRMNLTYSEEKNAR